MQTEAILLTERLSLHSITPAGVHRLFETRCKEEIMTFLGLDENGYQLYRDMHEQGMVTHRISMYVFLLRLKDTGEPIGECGFHTWNATHRRTEVFYSLKKEEYKQQGYMTEAFRAVIAFGFKELGLHRMEALVDKNNTASIRLLEKFGFRFEGTMREDYKVGELNEDSDCYSLLKQEWEQQAI